MFRIPCIRLSAFLRACGALPLLLSACAEAPPQQGQQPPPVPLTRTAADMPAPSAEGWPAPAILLGLFDPAQEPGFARIPDLYTSGNARGAWMQREALDAFVRMAAAAKQEGVSLTILSATRTFAYQTGIWEAKWTGAREVEGENLALTTSDPVERARKILRYSAMPGASRHHWGTDIDLNALTNSHFESGAGLKTFQWLERRAAEFGFCRPYTAKGAARPYGYEEEKWHWSYLPIAGEYLKAYEHLIGPEMIKGFKGDATAAQIQIIGHYVKGIAPECILP
ncbi:MAG: M15 family metallopeptidase [Bacteroidia bacterium]|nr:M15 family metallopeptidase [Bacteroidia bacterium]